MSRARFGKGTSSHLRSASAILVVRYSLHPNTGDSLPGGESMVVRAMLEEPMELYVVGSPVMDSVFVGGLDHSYIACLKRSNMVSIPEVCSHVIGGLFDESRDNCSRRRIPCACLTSERWESCDAIVHSAEVIIMSAIGFNILWRRVKLCLPLMST